MRWMYLMIIVMPLPTAGYLKKTWTVDWTCGDHYQLNMDLLGVDVAKE